MNEDEAVAKAAMGEDRQGGPVCAPVAGHEIGWRIEFADVEGVFLRHAPVSVLRAEARVEREVGAFDFYLSLFQGAKDLVIAAGERQMGAHIFSLVYVRPSTRRPRVLTRLGFSRSEKPVQPRPRWPRL